MKKKRGKENFCVRNYRASWKFLKESYNYVLIGLGIFCVFILLGFAFPTPAGLEKVILEVIEQMIGTFEGLNVYESMGMIFWNNSFVALMSILVGLVFGLLPIWNAISNGYLLGYLMKYVGAVEGPGALWRLVPHGIFELPAIFFAIGIGIKVGFSFFKKGESVKRNLKEGLRVWLFVIVPLLFVAAVIEGFLLVFA